MSSPYDSDMIFPYIKPWQPSKPCKIRNSSFAQSVSTESAMGLSQTTPEFLMHLTRKDCLRVWYKGALGFSLFAGAYKGSISCCKFCRVSHGGLHTWYKVLCGRAYVIMEIGGTVITHAHSDLDRRFQLVAVMDFPDPREDPKSRSLKGVPIKCP